MVEFKKANIKMASQNASNIVFRKDYTAPDHQIESIDLSFDLIPTCTEVTSKIIAVPQEDRKSDDLILDGDDLTLVSIKIAGDTFDEAVAAFMRKRYGMVIGLNTAEEVKITIGCVYDRPEEVSMLVKGRDLKTGLPKEEMVSSTELMEAFKRPARQIVDEVLAVLEMSSPELVADIARNGIVLTGGGSQLYGFDFLISERTEIACTIADDPDSCVALGCGKSLEWINSMQEGTINLARRKLMKEG